MDNTMCGQSVLTNNSLIPLSAHFLTVLTKQAILLYRIHNQEIPQLEYLYNFSCVNDENQTEHEEKIAAAAACQSLPVEKFKKLLFFPFPSTL